MSLLPSPPSTDRLRILLLPCLCSRTDQQEKRWTEMWREEIFTRKINICKGKSIKYRSGKKRNKKKGSVGLSFTAVPVIASNGDLCDHEGSSKQTWNCCKLSEMLGLWGLEKKVCNDHFSYLLHMCSPPPKDSCRDLNDFQAVWMLDLIFFFFFLESNIHIWLLGSHKDTIGGTHPHIWLI